MNNQLLASYIDHTNLKTDSTIEDINTLCIEAIQHNFASVCVYPKYVDRCEWFLSGSNIKVCSVVDFPNGSKDPKSKAREAYNCLCNGAKELDMVIDVEKLIQQDYKTVVKGIEAVVKEAGYSAKVKVIIETCRLSDIQKVTACSLSLLAGAHFVKTSTGFGSSGATIKDVGLMKDVVKELMEVKASGGIKTRKQAIQMINAGATRIGTSSGVAIINNTKY